MPALPAKSLLLNPHLDDVRARRPLHPFADEEARVRRLVVGDVLPRDAQAVLRVVHEGVEALRGRGGRRVDAQLLVVGRAPDDLLGDWREEVVWRTADNKELRVYTTTIPTRQRFYTFMHDPQYRLSVAWQNVAYNQPPHTSFFVGEGMKRPPRPDIVLAGPKRRAAGG